MNILDKKNSRFRYLLLPQVKDIRGENYARDGHPPLKLRSVQIRSITMDVCSAAFFSLSRSSIYFVSLQSVDVQRIKEKSLREIRRGANRVSDIIQRNAWTKIRQGGTRVRFWGTYINLLPTFVPIAANKNPGGNSW